MKEKNAKKSKIKTSEIIRVGGMALLNGVMMRSPNFLAVALDLGNGKIGLVSRKLKSLRVKYSFLSWPIIRGFVLIIETIASAAVAYAFVSRFATKAPAIRKAKRSYNCLSLIFYLLVISLIFDYFLAKTENSKIAYQLPLMYNLLTNLFFVLAFIVFFTIVFQTGGEGKILSYHGAEHKTINAYEHGAKLEPEEIKKFSRLHPRCGSIVAGYTIIIASALVILVPKNINWFLYFLFSTFSLFLSFSLAFELTLLLIRFYKNRISALLLWPAFVFQALVTREPEEQQLKIAVAALEEVVLREEEMELSKNNKKERRKYGKSANPRRSKL